MSKWLLLALVSITAYGEDYCFGFLNSHPERKELPEAEAQEIQRGHLAHMGRMGMAGHLLAAGPIMTSGGPRGIVIYRCKSLDEARQWTSLDPAVENKRLTLEVYRWHAADGIGEPLMAKLKANPGTKYEMTQLPLIIVRKTAAWPAEGPSQEVFMEHMKHNGEIRKQGKVRALGPFVDAEGRPGSIPGVVGAFVFTAMPLEEAKALAEQDAMVRGGYARVDAYTWMVADEVIPKAERPASASAR